MACFLITGGCGFIGTHLADALITRGDKVRIIDNLSTGKIENTPSRAELIIGDVTDADTLNRALTEVDGCFHLAAVSSVQACTEHWLDSHRVNLDGTIMILDAVRSKGKGTVPVVYASSAAVYGMASAARLDESVPPLPISPYGVDKAAGEMHARIAGIHFGVPTTGLRFFNVFGPRQDPRSPYSGVISIFIDRMLRGEPLTIHGDGGQVRDFIYVGDIVRFIMAAMDSSRPGARVLNACRGQGTSIIELANTIGDLIDRRPEFHFGPPRALDIRTSIGSPELAQAELKVAAEISLREGLTFTLDAMES